MLSRTMGIFTGNAHPALAEGTVRYLDCPLGRARVTQFTPAAQACPKLKVVSIAPLLAEAIRRSHHSDSVSALCL